LAHHHYFIKIGDSTGGTALADAFLNLCFAVMQVGHVILFLILVSRLLGYDLD
jgi:hypothetical protein